MYFLTNNNHENQRRKKTVRKTGLCIKRCDWASEKKVPYPSLWHWFTYICGSKWFIKKIPLHRKMFPGSNWHSLVVIYSNDPEQRKKCAYTLSDRKTEESKKWSKQKNDQRNNEIKKINTHTAISHTHTRLVFGVEIESGNGTSRQFPNKTQSQSTAKKIKEYYMCWSEIEHCFSIDCCFFPCLVLNEDHITIRRRSVANNRQYNSTAKKYQCAIRCIDQSHWSSKKLSKETKTNNAHNQKEWIKKTNSKKGINTLRFLFHSSPLS